MIEEILSPELVGIIISLVTVVGFGTSWLRIKTKFSEFRKLVVLVDDAVKDDEVTEQEFTTIWNTAKKLFSA